MKKRLLVGIFVSIVCLSCLAVFLRSERMRNPMDNPTSIKIRLNGDVGTVLGSKWPRLNKDKFCTSANLEGPLDLAVVLPSGKQVQLAARRVFIYQDNALIKHISVCYPCEVLNFPEAVSRLRAINSQIGIPTQSRIHERLCDWEKMQDPESVSIWDTIEDRVAYNVKIDRLIDRDGWYIELLFSYSNDNVFHLSRNKSPN